MITYSTNWMGPASLKGDINRKYYSGGRIDIRELDEDSGFPEGKWEYTLPLMLQYQYKMFSLYLRYDIEKL